MPGQLAVQTRLGCCRRPPVPTVPTTDKSTRAPPGAAAERRRAEAAPKTLPWHLAPGPSLALLAGNGPAEEKPGGRRIRAESFGRPPGIGEGGARAARSPLCPRTEPCQWGRRGPTGHGGAPRKPACEMLHALGSWRSNCACAAEG